jgi:putative oxidoreductase
MKGKSGDVAILVLRLALGAAMMYHGSQKLFGLFGGMGYEATLAAFQERNGIPPLFGWLAIIAEFFGWLGLVLGLLTRVAAFGVACTMAVAAYFHISRGDEAARVELPTAFFAMALAIMLAGAGHYSLDKVFFGRRGGGKS